MTWQDIINILYVERGSLWWAQLATSLAWSWVCIVLGSLLLIEFLRFFKVVLQQDGGIPKLRAIPSSRASRAAGIIWSVSLLAGIALTLVWRYTSNPANLLRDLNHAPSPWQLSPDGVTMLLGWLKSLGAIQILLALTGFGGFVFLLFFPLILASESQSSKKPSNQKLSNQEATPSASEEETTKETASAELGQQSTESASPGAPVTPASSQVREERTEPPAGLPKQENSLPCHRPVTVMGVSFVLKVRYTNPEWPSVYLDGQPWRVGEERTIRTSRLYIDLTGQHINTNQKQNQVTLWYQPMERRLEGYIAPDWDGHGDVHFGLGGRDKRYVYEGEFFCVGETLFQLASCALGNREEANVEE